MVSRVSEATIAMVEAAYDLEAADADWLPRVMETGLSVLDQGLGVAGGLYTRPLDGGDVTLHQLHVAAGPADFMIRQAQVTAECPAEVQQACTRPGICITLSEAAGKKHALGVESWTRHHPPSKDALGLSAVDPDGQGALIIAPLAERTTLRGTVRRRWQMVGAHLTTGYRLRQSIKRLEASDDDDASKGVQSELPFGAEAVLDPKQFNITDACGDAANRDASRRLRDAAVRVDRARGAMRREDPHEALRAWRSMVSGRWSMVDWFDTDGRRFVLAVQNPPDVGDPRGLTERELQVATYTALGDSGKLIAYRLGLSPARVGAAMHAIKQKLGVQTRAQLVGKLRGLLDLDRA